MWEWTVHQKPLPLKDLRVFQLYYLSVCRIPNDPTIVWGTDIRMEAVESYLRRENATGSTLLSPAHFLIKNVANAMQQHPEFNCRITRQRIFKYKQVNLIVPLFNLGGSEINTLLLENVASMSLQQIAEFLWRQTSAAARGEFDSVHQSSLLEKLPRWMLHLGMWMYIRLTNEVNFPKCKLICRENVSSMLVNYFGFRNAPPLRSYKPSRFPTDGVPFSITMGATLDQPVADSGNVVVGRVAPLFLRADHRIVDAFQMKAFLETLNKGFEHPESISHANRSDD